MAPGPVFSLSLRVWEAKVAKHFFLTPGLFFENSLVDLRQDFFVYPFGAPQWGQLFFFPILHLSVFTGC